MASGPVCVSGVTGYVAAQIVKDLLARGYRVRGTARRISDPSRLAHITSLPEAKANFEAFEADLLTEGAFDEALAGCTSAIHCASPYKMNVKDPKEELVRPAVDGTRSFLNSCAKAGTIKRIVVTSSVTAVTDEGIVGRVFTEDDWNTKSSETRLPYYYSKACSERAAWEFSESHPDISVVCINPGMVMGPSLVSSLNESPRLLAGIATGTAFPGVVDYVWSVVDVRDVSESHIAALENPNAKGRYICVNSERTIPTSECVDLLNQKGYSPKTMRLDGPFATRILKMMSYFLPAGHFIRQNFGNNVYYSNAKIKEDLGITFRDPIETIEDTLEDLHKWGHLSKPKQ